MTAWVCIVTLEAEHDGEVTDMVAALKDRFGERVRTRSVQKWLYDDERAPVRPFTMQVTNYMRRGR